MNRYWRDLRISAILLATAPAAMAYIDPGSGALVWQGVVAAIGAVLIFVREPWKTTKRWIRRLIGK